MSEKKKMKRPILRQKCWTCAKYNGGCAWSMDGVPVKGWEAYETYDAQGRFYSYDVRECPEYEKENRNQRRGDPQDIDTEGMLRLYEKILSQLRNDYRFGKAETRQRIERFLRSRRGQVMLQLSDPEEIIRNLRRMAYTIR